MTNTEDKQTLTANEFAHLGEGIVAYLREIDASDLAGKFPGMPQIAPGTRLWALFAADGSPILLSDERERALAGAMEHELTPVSLH
jgi:hypothetical protein